MFLNNGKPLPKTVGCTPSWYSSIKSSCDKATIKLGLPTKMSLFPPLRDCLSSKTSSLRSLFANLAVFHSTLFSVWEKTIFGMLSIITANSSIDLLPVGFFTTVRQYSIS
jgi:hypothetical protein